MPDRFDGQVNLTDMASGVGAQAAGQPAFGSGQVVMAETGAAISRTQDHNDKGNPAEIGCVRKDTGAVRDGRCGSGAP